MVQITNNGTDITDDVISYDRAHNICDGIAVASIKLIGATEHEFETWDKIVIREDGDKRMTAYISTITTDAVNGDKIISVQDGSKKLTDTFIDTQYEAGATTSRYWIEFFLDLAGVDYDFNVATSGTLVNEQTLFGYTTVYDQIVPLLQQNGWYFFFDEDDVCIVGKLDVNFDSYTESFDEDDILRLSVNKNDAMLRNRAVVWGGAEPFTNNNIFADISTITPWNYDEADVRTIVLANSYITSNFVAYQMAYQLLDEFAKITIEKAVEVHGFRDIQIGDIVKINTDYFTGTGLVTILQVQYSQETKKTTMILDKRCPRLFGYYSPNAEYVYIGTRGDGVYRKLLDGTSWSDYSLGLEDLNVLDLHINNGLKACVTSGFAYYRSPLTASWVKYTHPSMVYSGAEFPAEDIYPVACTINELTDTIIYGYTHSGEHASWAVALSATGGLLYNKPIITTTMSGDGYGIVDIATDDENVIITTKAMNIPPSGTFPGDIIIAGIPGTGNYGFSNAGFSPRVPDLDIFNIGPVSDPGTPYTKTGIAPLHDLKVKGYFVHFLEGTGSSWNLVKLDTRDSTEVTYTITAPTSAVDEATFFVDENDDYYIAFIDRTVANPFTLKVTVDFYDVSSTTQSAFATETYTNPVGTNDGTLIDVINSKDTLCVFYEFQGAGSTFTQFISAYSWFNGTFNNAQVLNSTSAGVTVRPGRPTSVLFGENKGYVAKKAIRTNSSTSFTIMLLKCTIDFESATFSEEFIEIYTYSNASMTSFSLTSSPNFAYEFQTLHSGLGVLYSFTNFALTINLGAGSVNYTLRTTVEMLTNAVIVHYFGTAASAPPFSYIGVASPFNRYGISSQLVVDLTSTFWMLDLLTLSVTAITDQPSGTPVSFITHADDNNGLWYEIISYTAPGPTTRPKLLGRNFIDGEIESEIELASSSFNSVSTWKLIGNHLVEYVAGTTRINIWNVDAEAVDDIIEDFSNGGDILRYTTADSEIIQVGSTSRRSRVEISKTSPAVVWTVPSGSLPGTYRLSRTMEPGSFTAYAPIPNSTIHDVRVFDIAGSGFIVGSGQLTDDYNRYIGIAGGEDGFIFSRLSLPSFIETLAPIDAGYSVTAIEASNYDPFPYIFYSAEGLGNRFFQRGPEASGFTEYNTGLPVSPIEIIRVDDRI